MVISFKEDLILLNISINSIIVYATLGSGINADKTNEASHILPHYVNLKAFMRVFHILKPALHNLEKNVCFLDIDDKYENIKISCDWCSICNGVFETAKQNIIDDSNLLKKINIKNLDFTDSFLDTVLTNRKRKITTDEIKSWCKKTFKNVTNDLLLLSSIYLKLELVELRWCPFKRSKEFYYRNKDHRYLIPTEQIIHKMGKILSEHETITCNNCPRIINEKWKFTKSNKKSIFQQLLEYMMEQIKTNKNNK